MKAVRAILLALVLGWIFPSLSPALADVAVPPLVGRVVDQTGTLSSGQIDSLQQTLRAFEARKGSQIAVLIVPTTAPETIEQYSLRVAEAWKIGRKKIDDGALLVIAKNDRHLRIEVGYGLEGALTDVTSKRIIDEIITPKFRSGDFAGGISTGVDRMIRIIDGEKLPAPPAPQYQTQQRDFGWLGDNPGVVLFGAVFIAGILRTLLGRLLGASVAGTLAATFVWYVAGYLPPSLAAGAFVFVCTLIFDPSSQGRGGSWSSGGSSSSGGSWGGSDSSSSSSSDSGGGGGSFGGGGASGSW
jgi:uncharacterized protein